MWNGSGWERGVDSVTVVYTFSQMILSGSIQRIAFKKRQEPLNIKVIKINQRAKPKKVTIKSAIASTRRKYLSSGKILQYYNKVDNKIFKHYVC